MELIGLKCGICEEAFETGDDVVVCPDCGTPMHRACYNETKQCPNFELHSEGFVFDGFDRIKDEAQGRTKDKNDNDDEDEEGDADQKIVTDAVDRLLSLQKRSESSDNACPICGTRQRQGANFCDYCGARLILKKTPTEDGEVDYSDPKFFASYAAGQSTDIPAATVMEDDVTAGDVACYVAVNAPYYLKAFSSIKEGKSKFNFGAAVFSGVWFLYRKLYQIGTLFLSIEVLLYVLNVYFTQNLSMKVMEQLLSTIGVSVNNMSSLTMEQYMELSTQMQKMPISQQLIMMMPTFLLILQIVVMVVSGSVANKLYYKQCVKKIREVKAAAAERALTRSEISQTIYVTGGVNAILAGLFGFLYLFLFFT